MKEIRTRETVQPRMLDKAAGMRRVKGAAFNTKPQDAEKRNATPENYAVDKVTGSTSSLAKHGALISRKHVGRMFKKVWKRAKENDGFNNDTASSHEYARSDSGRTYQRAGQGYQREQHVRHAAKNVQKGTGTVRQQARGGIKTVDKSIRTAKRGISTAKRTIRAGVRSVKTASRTVKTSAKTVKVSAKAAKAVARTAVKGIKLLVKAATTAIKAVAVAVKSLIAAIAAGGWIVLLVIVVVGAILIVVNSAFGIFYSNEDTGEEGKIPMSQAVAEISGDFSAYVDRQIASASAGRDNVTVEYDGGIDGDSDSINNWVDVLAIYAVKMTTDESEPMEVATVDEAKKQVLRDLYWDMNPVSIRVETVEEDANAEEAEPVEKTVVHVNISAEDYSDAARRYGFTEEQNRMLEELMVPENHYLFVALIGIDSYGGMSSQEVGDILNGLPHNVGGNIVRFALTRLGDPYSMAKRGQGNYVDCSYLVRWAYQQAGVTSYRAATAAEQARYCVNNDMLISRDELQPGDVVFWRKNGCHCGRYKEIHHVAIYIGGGMIIEASSSQGCVRIKELWGEGSGGKWQVFYYARPIN